MLTLATHNICLQKLVDEDMNVVKLATKKNKRKDEHILHMVSMTETRQDAALNVVPRVVFAAAFRYVISQLLTPFLRKPSLSFRFPRQYIPEKIFIRHCSLVR
ncbi:hypothetical protein ACFOTA_05360 [Chitinophaga sp. GCM10012297]|uniref:Uncharacterized protein n=1 Tax=Chitinophaga chungangae TaxID=2821488 RepID=A0ABS3YAC2_9BACT|nr:hypothetical protein [Chitinophaga chungangae]MBO9151623.1 hypothetical protein [Chitinophaga chungangae]